MTKRNSFKIFNKKNNGFIAYYNNSVNNTVTVILPYDPKVRELPENIRLRQEEKKKQQKDYLQKEEKRRKRNLQKPQKKEKKIK